MILVGRGTCSFNGGLLDVFISRRDEGSLTTASREVLWPYGCSPGRSTPIRCAAKFDSNGGTPSPAKIKFQWGYPAPLPDWTPMVEGGIFRHLATFDCNGVYSVTLQNLIPMEVHRPPARFNSNNGFSVPMPNSVPMGGITPPSLYKIRFQWGAVRPPYQI